MPIVNNFLKNFWSSRSARTLQIICVCSSLIIFYKSIFIIVTKFTNSYNPLYILKPHKMVFNNHRVPSEPFMVTLIYVVST